MKTERLIYKFGTVYKMVRAKPVLGALSPLESYHVTQGQTPSEIRDVAV